MALTNNLVLEPKDFPALAEAMSQRQPGDRLRLTLEVEVVENLAARVSFDVEEVEVAGGGAAASTEADDDEEEAGEASPLAASVMGVMGRKKK